MGKNLRHNPKYVALLRGINVGGNNLLSMPKLKAAFEKQGFDSVLTYINSGSWQSWWGVEPGGLNWENMGSTIRTNLRAQLCQQSDQFSHMGEWPGTCVEVVGKCLSPSNSCL